MTIEKLRDILRKDIPTNIDKFQVIKEITILVASNQMWDKSLFCVY